MTGHVFRPELLIVSVSLWHSSLGKNILASSQCLRMSPIDHPPMSIHTQDVGAMIRRGIGHCHTFDFWHSFPFTCLTLDGETPRERPAGSTRLDTDSFLCRGATRNTGAVKPWPDRRWNGTRQAANNIRTEKSSRRTKKSSHTGNWTRAFWVKARYPNH